MTLHRITVVSVAVVAVLILFLVVLPWAQEELAPEPVAAWVAVELGGSGVARVGTLRTTPGTECRLHAVLEARGRGGESVFYTDAEALEIPGRTVSPESLRRWDRSQEVKVLWFTVEGLRAFWELGADGFDGFGFESSFRADWPRTWSIPCAVDSSSQAFGQGFDSLEPREFGTQRYQVRIEIWGVSRIAPEVRFTSWSGEELPIRGDDFPGLIVRLPGLLGAASEVFGLTQVAVTDEASPEARERLADWGRRRLVFSRAQVLTELTETAGSGWAALEWREVDLSDGPEWTPTGAAPGDPLRVAERVVLLYEDRGLPGRLDRADLAFDFTKGSGVRSLGEIFVGDGLVEWAHLTTEGTERTR